MTEIASASVRYSSTGAEQVKQEAAKVAGAVKDTGKASADSAAGFGSLTQAAGALGAGLSAMGIAKATADFFMLGDASLRAKSGLDALTSGNADEYIEAVKTATMGATTEFEAARIAMSFVSMGLAETSDQAAEFARIAAVLGGTFRGLGAAEAADEFKLLLANTSVLRLDTFGISAAAVKARIQELQEVTPGLTREQAFLNAVMEIGGARADELQSGTAGLTTEMSKLRAQITDAATALAEDLASGINKIIAGYTALKAAQGDFRDQFREQIEDIAISSDSIVEYKSELTKLGREYGLTAQQMTALLADASPEAWKELQGEIAQTSGELERFTFMQRYASSAAVEVGDSIAEQAASYANELQPVLENVTRATREMTTAIEEQAGRQLEAMDSTNEFITTFGGLADIYERGVDVLGNYNLSNSELLQKQRDLALATGALSEKQIAQSDAFVTLDNLYAAGVISADQYADSIVRIKQGYDATAEAAAAAAIPINAAFAEGNVGFIAQQMDEAAAAAQGLPQPMEDFSESIQAAMDLINGIPPEIQMDVLNNLDSEVLPDLKTALDNLTEIGLGTELEILRTPEFDITNARTSEMVTRLQLLTSRVWRISIVVDQEGSVPDPPGGYATGGLVGETGMYMVGERGPEIVQLPAGARVIDNGSTQAMLAPSPSNQGMNMGGGGMQSAVIENVIYLDGQQIYESTVRAAFRNGRAFSEVGSN